MKLGKRLPSIDEREETALGSMVNGTIAGDSKIGMPVVETQRVPFVAPPPAGVYRLVLPGNELVDASDTFGYGESISWYDFEPVEATDPNITFVEFVGYVFAPGDYTGSVTLAYTSDAAVEVIFRTRVGNTIVQADTFTLTDGSDTVDIPLAFTVVDDGFDLNLVQFMTFTGATATVTIYAAGSTFEVSSA